MDGSWIVLTLLYSEERWIPYYLPWNLDSLINKQTLTVCRDALSRDKKVIKFHGNEVENVTILYSIRHKTKPIITRMEEFDALKDARPCESINIQVVADFVTITFYKQESTNSITSRELIPLHATEHLWVKDIPIR
jgi:hypothetical protein